ncbi:DUF6777 domain-containing protein [Streptomyces sp. NPDC101733]|uniref:DUF6777 domain-containing protein n=1 Tax=unclassified Streptomyces TaxID=2593676 RepID=UPI00380C2D08
MPRLVTVAVALAAVAALVVVLTRPDGGGSTQHARAEVFLQPAGATGPDPFTASTANRRATPPAEPPRAPAPSATPTGTPRVSGAAPGLYGGTKDVASCDVEKQITALSAQPAKNGAFASALGIRPAAVPGYLRSLTAVQLRVDTRVTNHGFRDGRANAYQAVLQAGTAVLVDDRGVPRVRCACGNPLGEPVALPANPERHGQPWNAYQPARVVVIAPSTTVINKIVIYDHQDNRWYERGRGPGRDRDEPVVAPVVPPVVPPVTPSGSPPTSPASPRTSPPTSPPISPGDSSAPPGTTSPPATGSDTPAPEDSGGTPSDGPSTGPSDSGPAGPSDTPAGPSSGTPSDTPDEDHTGTEGGSSKPALTDRTGTPTGADTPGASPAQDPPAPPGPRRP